MQQTDLAVLPMKQQKALSTSKLILTAPIQLISLERQLQPKDVFENAPLGEVYKGDFSVIGFKTVHTLVNRFLESFAFTTKLTESQKQILTSDTLDAFKFDTLEDIILFFKNARKGNYGVAKKGVDANTILGDWLPQYLEEKARFREELLADKKAKNTTFITDTSKTIAFYQEHEKNKKAQALANKMMDLANEAAKDIDRQMLEDLILHWTKDAELRPFVNLLKVKRKQIKK